MPVFADPELQNSKSTKENEAFAADEQLVGENVITENTNKAIRNWLSLFGGFLLGFFQEVGAFSLLFVRGFSKWISALYSRHLRPHVRRIHQSFYKRISRLLHRILARIERFFRFFTDAARVVRNGFCARRNVGIGTRLLDALRAFGRGVQNNAHFFVTIINYTLPVVGILILIHLVNYAQSLHFAVMVEYNGQQIGYVENEAVFEQANQRVQQRLTYLPTDELVDHIPRYTVALVDPAEVQTTTELTDAIIETAGVDMVQATGFYIDGKLMGVVRDFSEIQATLNQMLDAHKTNQEGERVEFVKQVESEPGLYLASNLVDPQSILDIITTETQGAVYYTVQEGDAPSSIAQKYGMTLDELVSLNPNVLDSLLIGQNVLVRKSEPYLEVKCIRQEIYTEDIPYGNTYTSSSSLWEGTEQVVSNGTNGKKSVTAEVAYVDGTEVSRKILSETTITEPINAVVAKGSKPMLRDPDTYIGATHSKSGMMNPVSAASPYISQVYGYTRYNPRHNGIDIAFRGNGYGVPIYSVLPGTVQFAGWQGSYGYLVIVDHGNGCQTYYAHCSKLYVRTGDTVAQGETIAAVGSTGVSSGNHLHFRVIYNYYQQDPEDYIPGYVRGSGSR